MEYKPVGWTLVYKDTATVTGLDCGTPINVDTEDDLEFVGAYLGVDRQEIVDIVAAKYIKRQSES